MPPKTLLLTNHAPGRKSAGGVFIQKLLDYYQKNDICCFHTKPVPEGQVRPELSWLPVRYGQAPTKYGLRRFGYKIWRLSRPFMEYYYERFKTPGLVNKAVRFGKEKKVELVIATLDSITTVRVAKPVAEAIGVPLIVIVWDPPKYNLCNKYKLDNYSCNRLLKTFDETIRYAKTCSVPSEGMKRKYEEDYNTKCVVMVFGDKPSVKIKKIDTQLLPDNYLIGFAGSIIAKNVWDAFVFALAEKKWKINGRDVVIRMHGPNLHLNTEIPLKIEYRGWNSHSEMIQSLSEADISYLPYWFDESQKEFVTLSFPSKMAAYLAAEAPIFFHGPENSTAVDFILKHHVGVCCHSLKAVEIIDKLENFLGNSDAIRNAKKACTVAFEEELSVSVFDNRLREFIGSSERKPDMVVDI